MEDEIHVMEIYCDSHWAGSLHRRSTTSVVILLNRLVVFHTTELNRQCRFLRETVTGLKMLQVHSRPKHHQTHSNTQKFSALVLELYDWMMTYDDNKVGGEREQLIYLQRSSGNSKSGKSTDG